MTLLRLAFSLRKTALRFFAALLDRRVPAHLKLLTMLATLFILSPLNILGDIPLLGMLDDAGLLTLVMLWFTRASTPYINLFNA